MTELVTAEIGVEVEEPSDNFEDQRREVAAALGLEDSGIEEYIAATKVFEDDE
jgi:hypothetical protein